jgi:hypothetical protein
MLKAGLAPLHPRGRVPPTAATRWQLALTWAEDRGSGLKGNLRPLRDSVGIKGYSVL